MKLYFVRHGIADAPEGYTGTDFERPLTSEGRKKMTSEAKALASLKLGVDVIITSPLVRAQQTATIVAKELDMDDRLHDDARLGPDLDVEALASLLDDHATTDTIMLVGHEPSFSEVVGSIVGGAAIDLKKGGVACVEVTERAGPRGILLWLATPKLLRNV